MECLFCHPEDSRIKQRIIKLGVFSYSLVSRPWMREDHCLAIPYRHVVSPDQLTGEEVAEMVIELGRIGALTDTGYGYEVRQKYAPTTPDDTVKQSHLHFHVIPRLQSDGVFAKSPNNSFDDFVIPSDEQIAACLEITAPSA